MTVILGTDGDTQNVSGIVGLSPIATTGSGADLNSGSVGNAQLATMPAHRWKGNPTGSTAAPVDATDAQLRADLSVNIPSEGAALTDGALTINPASEACSQRTLPATVPLTNDRTYVLGVTGSPITNSVFSIVKRGAGAHTLTVNDDAATQLFVFASGSTNQQANFYFDGTHYKFLSLVLLAA